MLVVVVVPLFSTGKNPSIVHTIDVKTNEQFLFPIPFTPRRATYFVAEPDPICAFQISLL